jgi:hypothetical protein
MVSQTANKLSDTLREKAQAIAQGASGLTDADARKRPADGEWSVAEVLSHLCGEDATAFLSTVTRFASEDVPQIDVIPGVSHFESRGGAPVAELVSSFRSQYEKIVDYVAGLDDGQLTRTAHIPLFKETPFGEYPTLEQWVTGLTQFHVGGHVTQIGEIRQKIGV